MGTSQEKDTIVVIVAISFFFSTAMVYDTFALMRDVVWSEELLDVVYLLLLIYFYVQVDRRIGKFRGLNSSRGYGCLNQPVTPSFIRYPAT